MSTTKINLDRQAQGQTFAMGTTASGGQAALTLNNGTAAASNVVLNALGTISASGDLNLGGNLNITGSINETSVTNLQVTDKTVTVNNGGSTAGAAGSGVLVQGDSAATIGALTYASGSATKFQVGNGTTQVDVVDVSTAQTLTNKTISLTGNTVTGTLPVTNGGTGQTAFTDGQLLIGNTATGGLAKATLTQGTGIAITNSNGAITIAATGGGSSTTYQRVTAVSGTQDGSNKTFTIANAVSSGSEQVFHNGILMNPGATNDYVISGTTVTFQSGFTAPSSTDVIRVYGTY